MVTSEPKLLLIVLSRPMFLMQLVSVLMSFAHVTTGDHVIQVFNHELKKEGLTELALPLTDMGRVTHPLPRVLTQSQASPGIMDPNDPGRGELSLLFTLGEGVSVAGTNQLSSHPGTNPGL